MIWMRYSRSGKGEWNWPVITRDTDRIRGKGLRCSQVVPWIEWSGGGEAGQSGRIYIKNRLQTPLLARIGEWNSIHQRTGFFFEHDTLYFSICVLIPASCPTTLLYRVVTVTIWAKQTGQTRHMTRRILRSRNDIGMCM